MVIDLPPSQRNKQRAAAREAVLYLDRVLPQPDIWRLPYDTSEFAGGVPATFVGAAIERYLPGVEQFVVLGAGYDTRTVQLQHNRRIHLF